MVVSSGVQTPQERFVHASTTTVRPLAQAMLKPKLPAWDPKRASHRICGYQQNVGRPPKVAPQPVVPGK